MEASGNYSLCILCCYSVPFNPFQEQNNRQFIGKFIQQTGIKTISSSNDLLEDGQLSICANCIFTLNQAVDNREQVEEVEVHVRNLQEEILRLLKQLKALMDGYLEGMRRLEGTIKNSDESCLRSKLGWSREKLKTAENVLHFRHGIINVVEELSKFREDLNSKLVHNSSTELTNQILKTEQVNIELCEDPEINWDNDDDDDPLGDDNDPLGDLEKMIGQLGENKGSESDEEVDGDNGTPTRIPSQRPKKKMKFYLELSDEDDSKDLDEDFEPGSISKEPQEESEDDDDDPLSSSKQQKRSERKSYNCVDCGQIFNRVKAFLSHAASQHSNLRPFQCSQCSKTFNRPDALKGHQVTHRDKKAEQQYRCDLCSKLFCNKNALDKHRKAHKERYPCTECGAVFVVKGRLKKHLAMHEKKKQIEWLKCDKCANEYETKEKLEKHWKVHERKKEHRCEHCNRVFESPSSLRKHISEVHLRAKPVTCTICGIGFSRDFGLKQHMLRIHYPEKWAELEKKRQKKKEGGGDKEEKKPEGDEAKEAEELKPKTVHYQDDFLVVYS